MKLKRIIRIIVILIVLISNVGCDQISKSLVRQRMGYYEEISLMFDYVTLTKVENTGAFLSAGQSLPQSLKILLLTILPVVVLALAVIYVFTKKGLSRVTTIGICFVVGGGIGNIYDRVVYGSVTDFLHINFVVFETGIFNLADVSIMGGLLIVLLATYLNRDSFSTTKATP